MTTEQFGFNGNIFTEPFKDLDIKVKINSGFATIAQKHTLTPLKVVVGNKDKTVLKGDIVYVDSSSCKQRWATQIFEIPNTGNCIVVPEAFIIMVEGSRIKFNPYTLNIKTSDSTL